MKEDAIGVFDSGLGGLTAVRELFSILPDEKIIYFGDTARVPYGTRPKETILKYVRQDIRFLKTFEVKALLFACGTTSALALPEVKDELDLPAIGVVLAASRAAAKVTKSGRIGVIGTQGTILSGAYEKTLGLIDKGLEVKTLACPLLVPLVEEGRFLDGDPVTTMVLKEYLSCFEGFSPDVLILGCTHYPLLKKLIAKILGDGIALIDAGKEGAAELFEFLSKEKLLSSRKKPEHQFFVSAGEDSFVQNAEIFLQGKLKVNAQKVEIDRY